MNYYITAHNELLSVKQFHDLVSEIIKAIEWCEGETLKPFGVDGESNGVKFHVGKSLNDKFSGVGYNEGITFVTVKQVEESAA